MYRRVSAVAATLAVAVATTACGDSPSDQQTAFCNHIEDTRTQIMFDQEMTADEIVATTVRGQEVYAEAARLAPATIRPAVERTRESWSNLERRFGEAFAAGLTTDEAFNAILVEWEDLVDVPANDEIVAYFEIDCDRGTRPEDAP